MCALAYIGFGSNLGDREELFREALAALAAIPRTQVAAYSRVYETEPVGLTDGGPPFLNAAIALETELEPAELMRHMRAVELRLGKAPSHRSDRSRRIDLDMLLYSDVAYSDESIEIPHPRMHKRAFVLAPLSEIAPEATHPTLRLTVRALFAALAPEEKDGVVPVTKE